MKKSSSRGWSRSTLKLLQVLLGPLPPTLLLLPSVVAGLAGLLIGAAWELATAGVGAFLGKFPFVLMFWEIGAVLGVVGLWLAILVSPKYLAERPGRRLGIGAMLTVGLVTAIGWFLEMRSHSSTYGLSSWVTWIGLLGGPICVGTYRLYRLMTHRRGAP